jgi:catechol 2,3-dioxygenase-like lactoylglutathione lyase family enzyme
MKRMLIPAVVAAGVALWTSDRLAQAQAPLPAPGFHHLHLNATDPDTALAFYTRQHPSTSKTMWNGIPALAARNNVMVLFTKVDRPPPVAEPQTAVWHFGFHVTDIRKQLETYKSRPEVKVQDMYGEDGKVILVSSDALAGTQAEIDAARAAGKRPEGGAGVLYIAGPDNALIENIGNQPVERFNHVHMLQEDPFCAQIWYQRHLNAAVAPALKQNPQRTEANCKVPRGVVSWPALMWQGMHRIPNSGVLFGDVAVNWPVNQNDRPLAPTRGHLVDHFGLSVNNLDAWVAKLRAEGVKFLQEPYALGSTRAVMIEGPSKEAIELVEVK